MNPAIATSLYVHIPFCHSRCGYCTFASGLYDSRLVNAYLDALIVELCRSDLFNNSLPESVFIGGGTPSSLTVSQLEKLLRALPLHGEVTVEMNPDSVDPEKLALLKDCGVNRCSLGVQTFNASGLQLLDRRHDSKTAIAAVEAAVRSGFNSVSIDLINGWPGQTREIHDEDLKIAVSLGLQHISNYNLIVDAKASKAEIFSRLLDLQQSDDARDSDFWQHIEEYLERVGFIHYETSNFCRNGFVCRHNVHIWRGGEYLGIGAAAHSHIGGRRFSNTEDTVDYIRKIEDGASAEVFSEILDEESKARECAVFWLRLLEGIELRSFRESTGYDFEILYADILPHYLEQGYLEYDAEKTHIRVAKCYHPLLDAILIDMV